MPSKTQREREADQRKEKLDRIRDQVKDGSLVIRKMTEEERARFAAGRSTSATESQRPRRRTRARRPLPPAPRK